MAEENNNDALSNLPALHPDRLKANMPDAIEADKEADRLVTLADPVKRTGAGGVIPGQVGIRPSGMGAFNEFHEKFTETGKLPKKEKPTMDLRPDIGLKYEGPRFKVVEIPFQLCVYCLKKNINPAKPDYMLNFLPITPDNRQMFQAVGMIVGDVVRHAICKGCKTTMKADLKSEMVVMHEGQPIEQKYIKAAEHAKVMQENVVAILRQSQLQEMGRLPGEGFRAGVGS